MSEEELTVVVEALRELRLRLNAQHPQRALTERLILRALSTGSLEKTAE